MKLYPILNLPLAICALGCLANAHPEHERPYIPQAAPAVARYGFDSDALGTAPEGFEPTLTAGGGPVKWAVAQASDAPSSGQVVAQLSQDLTSARYPLLVLRDFSAKDVDLSVKFKTVAGTVDQAAGLVWRWQDKDNYLVVRANALENNVVAYQTVAGVRTSIGTKGNPEAYGVDAPVLAQSWNTLRVRSVGDEALVYLNGAHLFTAETSTFTSPGKVGLWTKADSVIWFDDLSVTDLDSAGETD